MPHETYEMIIWLAVVVIGVFAILSLYTYLNQGSIVFQPSRRIFATPDEFDLVYDDVRIHVSDGDKIHAWYFPDSDDSTTVLFCHGNAGNMSSRLETVQMLTEMGANVLLFDYRGYGLSDSEPSEKKMYADAEAAYNWLLREKAIASHKVIIFGRSLGGAVGVELAGRVDCAGLIIESSFTSVAEMGRHLYPYLPTRWLVRYHFDSIARIGQLECPVLVMHSQQDEIVPFRMGRRLYEAARAPKRFVELRGGHVDQNFSANNLYRNELREFIKSG